MDKIIIGLIIGVIISLITIFLIDFFVFRKKRQLKYELDQKTINLNNKLKEQLQTYQLELTRLETQREGLLKTISDLELTAQQSGEALLHKNLELANEKFAQATKDMEIQYAKAEDEYQQEYLNTLSECSVSLLVELSSKQDDLQKLNMQIENMRARIASAVAEAKREQEKKDNINFYRLILSEQDLKEIAILREATTLLRNSEPINKVIWKVYYEKPYTDLIGRVVGSNIHCGIYKITNLENEMCYVGQAVNIADRWKQHIKRGIGAEPVTRNKLYPAMIEYGVENFTFEILEECDRDKLNDLEDYWQDFYKAKEFGYSIK